MCTLREYKPGDECEVFALVENVLKQYGLSVNPEETDADITDIHKSYILSGSALKVIEDNGKIFGLYGIYTIDEGACELRKMYFWPEYKGKGPKKKL